MGFLKKITRPISRALDKIVPNEIKPALPFLAAAAPFMAPGLMSIGGNTMLSRALISGGLNLGSQLAQEGSEGDFDALSLAMASGIGALSAPNAASTIRGVDPNFVGPRPAPEGILGQGKEFLAQGSDKLIGLQEGLAADGIFSKAGAKALSIPLTQGTTDLAVAETRRFEKQQAIDEALSAAEGMADSAARAAAIRNSMTAYGFFTDEEIEDTIASAGYRAGGRVGLKGGGMDASNPDFGGIPAAMENIKEDAEEMITIMTDNGPIQIEKSVYESMPGMFMDTTTSAYGDAGRGRPVPQFADGGIMKAKRGLVNEPGGYAGKTLFGDIAEIDIGESIKDSGKSLINMFSPSEIMRVLSEAGEGFKEIYFNLKSDSERENLLKKIMGDSYEEKAKGGRVGAEEGGLMNLGGKEMDLRKGGFVPIGKKERADDVPARLSKNEFVMTADAVKGAGNGSINKGAKRMYDLMNKLESKV